jgi:hypothetical protein
MLFPDAGPGRLVHSGTVAPFPAPFDQRFSPADQPGSGRELARVIRTGPPSSRRSSWLDYVRVYQDAGPGHRRRGLRGKERQSELEQNHPNPFSGQTTITFSLPTEEQVVLELYDSTGRRVRTLADQRFAPGTHAVELGSGGLTPGLYTYRLLSSQGSSTRQMLIL